MLDVLKKNKIVLVVIAFLVAGFVWYGMSGGSAPETLITTDALGGVGSPQAAQERAMLDTLFQLKAIQLSGNIFSNVAFQSLRDFRTEIVSEPIGRKNPFAPLGDDGGTVEAGGNEQ
jgi:hypothetical protein